MYNAHPAGAYFDQIKKAQRATNSQGLLDDASGRKTDPGADPLSDQLAGTTGGISSDLNKDKTPAIISDAQKDPALDDAAGAVVDPGSDAAADYTDADLDLSVAGAMHQWAETADDDLDDGESLADRLQAMLIGIADPDFNGDINEDESDLIATAMESAGDYLADKGVSEEDISALLNDLDVDAAARVQELLANKLPSDADGIADDIDSHAFDDDDDDEVDPDALLDATMVNAIRNGKKVRIKKRLSGRVRLSAKQKLAIRKMQKKSHSARAQMRRLKSDKVRSRLFGKK